MNIIEKTYSTNGSMSTRTKTTRIILHHAAATNCTADDIDRWHKNKGYSKIGYHFFVRKDGSIYRGREENKIGAHAYGSNSDSIGICAEGNFQNEIMPEVQKNSLKELVSYLKNKYGINKVQRHSDVCSTACPGSNYPFNEIANATGVIEVKPNTPTNIGNSIINNIQSTLNSRYGFNIKVDGIFGTETHKAMTKALQIELNRQCGAKLIIDGIFGPKTKSACPTLKNSVSGNITWLVQAMLVIKGYNIAIDGIYGPNTINVIKQFQTRSGITSDGLCGKNTFEKLFK